MLPGDLPSSVARAAAFLTEAGHLPHHAAAMASGLMGVKVRDPRLRAYRHLRMTAQERADLAGALLARRVLAEGMLLALSGGGVREGTVLSAHKLCEARTMHGRGLDLALGGHVASESAVDAARTRLALELRELDELVEAAVASDEPLSAEKAGPQANARVVHLQNRLNSLGHRLQCDGVFGPMTTEAVKDFQTQIGLDASGEVDGETALALRRGGRREAEMVDAQPGLIPGQAQSAGAAESPQRSEVNGDTAALASDAKDAKGAKGKRGRRISVHLDLGEAGVSFTRLAEAYERRRSAIKDGDVLEFRRAAAAVDALVELVERDFSQDRREALAKQGHAMRADGKVVFPIENREDLKNAVGLWKSGHHQTDAAKAHICRQAKRLGVPDPFSGAQESVEEAWSEAAREAALAARREKREAAMPEGLQWNKRKGQLEGKFHGVALRRGVAYQGELAGGKVFTGHWTGTVDHDRQPVFAHVDTGEKRVFTHGKFYGKLSDIQSSAPNEDRSDEMASGPLHMPTDADMARGRQAGAGAQRVMDDLVARGWTHDETGKLVPPQRKLKEGTVVCATCGAPVRPSGVCQRGHADASLRGA